MSEEAIDLCVGSPPCTYFSIRQDLNLSMHRNDPEWMKRCETGLDKAKKHVELLFGIVRSVAMGIEMGIT